MSAADGMRIAPCAADITEIGAARGRTAELVAHLRERGAELPQVGRVAMGAERLLLCVRPGRWLMIATPKTEEIDVAGALWRHAGDALGGTVDLSAAYAAFLLRGSRSAEVLSRGCRMDLDPQVFPTGSAAATVFAQTQVCMASLPTGMLMLVSSSLQRHFREWLLAMGSPFQLVAESTITVAELCRSSDT